MKHKAENLFLLLVLTGMPALFAYLACLVIIPPFAPIVGLGVLGLGLDVCLNGR